MKQGITIQERLKDLRIERNLKLEELAAATGISKSALGSYENDDYKEISHKNLVELAKFYDVSTDYLLNIPRWGSHRYLFEIHLYMQGSCLPFAMHNATQSGASMSMTRAYACAKAHH